MAEVRAVIASHKTEVEWMWIEYVRKVKQYCQENLVLNANNEKVPMYFEDVPYLVQRRFMKEAIERVGLHTIVADVVQRRKNISEIAQSVVQENTHQKTP